MPQLSDVLTAPEKKAAVVDECLTIIDAEVSDKSGLSGLAIKAGFGAVKSVKPGFIKHAVEDLLPEFAVALDPVFQDALAQSSPIGEFFTKNSGRVADALLAITDGKAQRSSSSVVKGTYDKLRGSAKKNVESAVPRLGKLVEKYAK